MSWRPTATRATLERRAQMLSDVRQFFRGRGVLEIDTPMVVSCAVTDVHIHSAKVVFPESAKPYFLHTSPEYAMKRLLAAGSGDIFQICHVARGLERGRLHNAEFTLIEWYRCGFSLEQLMQDVAELVQAVWDEPRVAEYLTYRAAFERELSINPFTIGLSDLQALASAAGLDATSTERDELLDMLIATHVGPRLGREQLTFLHHYPASQAALAQLDPADPRCALRFELYSEGVELANGFKELASPGEQRARFEQDNRARRKRGLPEVEIDERLLAALGELPDCAGVALGFDRLVMLAQGARNIDEVLCFPIETA